MDFQSTGRGKSWVCAAGDHRGCNQAGCVCQCHYMIGGKDSLQREIIQQPLVKVPNPPTDVPVVAAADINPSVDNSLRCPKCGAGASRSTDRFCRRDGTRLEAPHCGGCGAEVAGGDQYCAGCGQPVGEGAPSISSPSGSITTQ